MAWYSTLLRWVSPGADDPLAPVQAALDTIAALRGAEGPHPSVSSLAMIRLGAALGRPAREARVMERFEAARTQLAAGETEAAVEALDALWLDVDRLARDLATRKATRKRRMRIATVAVVIAITALTGWMRRPQPLSADSLHVVGPLPFAAAADGYRVDPQWTDEHLRRLSEVYFGHRDPPSPDLLVGLTAINPSSASSHEATRIDVIARMMEPAEVPYARLPVDAALTLTPGPLLPTLAVTGLGPAVDVAITIDLGEDAGRIEEALDDLSPRGSTALSQRLIDDQWQAIPLRDGAFERRYVRLPGGAAVDGVEQITCAGDGEPSAWAVVERVEALRALPGARVVWAATARVTVKASDLRGRPLSAEWAGTTPDDRAFVAGVQFEEERPCQPAPDPDPSRAKPNIGFGDIDAPGMGRGGGGFGEEPEVQQSVYRTMSLGDHPGSSKESFVDLSLDLDLESVEVGRPALANTWVRKRLSPGGHLRVGATLKKPAPGQWALTWQAHGQPIAEATVHVPAWLPDDVRYADDGVAGARRRLGLAPAAK